MFCCGYVMRRLSLRRTAAVPNDDMNECASGESVSSRAAAHDMCLLNAERFSAPRLPENNPFPKQLTRML